MDTSIDLPAILDAHRKWWYGEPDGVPADLSYRDLDGARLDGASLVGASLDRASLVGARLVGASLADSTGLPFRYLDIGPIGSRNDRLIWRGDERMVRAGCFYGTLDAFEARVAEFHGNNEHAQAYRAAITFIRALDAIDAIDAAAKAAGAAAVSAE